MRIGILCHPTFGGSGVLASELALSLCERGHRVHLFSHAVPPRLARSTGPVEVHACSGMPYPLFPAPLHDLAIVSRVLDAWRGEGLDVLHAHYALPHAVSAVLAKAAVEDAGGRLAVVTTLHGTDITIVGSDPAYAPLTQFALRRSDAITCVSSSLAEDTRRTLLADLEPALALDVVPNFVDSAAFRPDPRAKHGERIAVHVSNFREVKRVPWLVEAFAEATAPGSGVEEARLRLVGEGPELERVRRLCHTLGVQERVELLGQRDAIPELLTPACVFLLTSREESFGLSALEAMACGVPVLATDVGGVSEVVVAGRTGELVERDDQAGFVARLRALLGDPLRTDELGAEARRRAQRCFDRAAIVDRYEALYRRVLAS